MSNQEHLQLLRAGEKTWNAWRRSHPEVAPNLSGANLRKLYLRSFDLSRCDLSSADARDVSFRKANLTGANLQSTKLYRAFFSRADLRDADFSGATLYETVFADVDLSSTRGLATCIHKGPTVVDHRSLARSHGLPLQFLRGSGLPDLLITESKQDDSSIARYRSSFISYSSEDQDFAERLYNDLQEKGVRCWYAPKSMRIGDKIRDAIDEAIRDADHVILILSNSSLSSGWVEKEFETTFEEETRRGKPMLFPIRLDDAAISDGRSWVSDVRRGRYIGNFTRWRDPQHYSAAFRMLLGALEQ